MLESDIIDLLKAIKLTLNLKDIKHLDARLDCLLDPSQIIEHEWRYSANRDDYREFYIIFYDYTKNEVLKLISGFPLVDELEIITKKGMQTIFSINELSQSIFNLEGGMLATVGISDSYKLTRIITEYITNALQERNNKIAIGEIYAR